MRKLLRDDVNLEPYGPVGARTQNRALVDTATAEI